MKNPVVELKNLSKFFGGNQVIHHVNLAIENGKFVTFLGPSGCGKTTLLRMIAGFYQPDEGEIIINGRNVENVPPYDRNTAMVFQEYALFPHMTVYENVAYGLEIKKVEKTAAQQRIDEVLNLMQLKGYEQRYPNQLSGGQQQRVAVARALVMNPHALLLDEPLSNLDAKLRESVRTELRMIQQKLGLTAIYVTHDQQEALSMSDCIVVMKSGVIHQYGTPQEIYFSPRTPFVADFIGTTNLLACTIAQVDGDKKTVAYGDLIFPVLSPETVAINSKVHISIRPECISICEQADTDKTSLPVTIKEALFLGEKVRYLATDSVGGEWIADVFDSGKHILHGSAWLTFGVEKPHLIVASE